MRVSQALVSTLPRAHRLALVRAAAGLHLPPPSRAIAAPAGRGARRVAVQSQKKDIMMWEALREATDEEMERDPTVCVMGGRVGAACRRALVPRSCLP